MGTEQILSGTTVNSHPFLVGLHPFIAFFATKVLFPPQALSGSPPVTVRIGHVCIITVFSWGLAITDTRFSWAWLWFRHRNGSSRSFLFISSTITRA